MAFILMTRLRKYDFSFIANFLNHYNFLDFNEILKWNGILKWKMF